MKTLGAIALAALCIAQMPRAFAGEGIQAPELRLAHDEAGIEFLPLTESPEMDSDLNFSSIPEPSVAIAMAGGIAILVGWRRFRS